MAENPTEKKTTKPVKPAPIRYEFAELILCLKNNWVYRTDFKKEKPLFTETKFRLRFDTEEAALYRELAKMGGDGWQVTQILEADIDYIGRSRVYFLLRELS